MNRSLVFASLVVAAAFPAASYANLFTDGFHDASSSSNWLVQRITASTDIVNYSFNYSAEGIPEAPNSPVGSPGTRGLFVAVNKPALPATAGVNNGLNLLAALNGSRLNLGQEVGLEFDMWLNVGLQPTLLGTTEIGIFGLNKNNTTVNRRTGAAQTDADGCWAWIASEGGFGATSTTPNSRDYVHLDGNTVVPGGRLDNNEEPFRTLWPSTADPAFLGMPLNSWVRVKIEESGNNVVVSMNGTVVSTAALASPGSGSPFLGYQDPFAGSLPGLPAKSFAIFDNVRVYTTSAPHVFTGTVDLLDFDSDAGQLVTVELVDGNDNTVQKSKVPLAAGGEFSFATSYLGDHTVYISGLTWLRKSLGIITLSSGGSTTVSSSLRNGDVNGDNEIGAADFSALAAAYDSVLGETNYSRPADLNGDEEVGAADFSILAANYDEVGD